MPLSRRKNSRGAHSSRKQRKQRKRDSTQPRHPSRRSRRARAYRGDDEDDPLVKILNDMIYHVFQTGEISEEHVTYKEKQIQITMSDGIAHMTDMKDGKFHIVENPDEGLTNVKVRETLFGSLKVFVLLDNTMQERYGVYMTKNEDLLLFKMFKTKKLSTNLQLIHVRKTLYENAEKNLMEGKYYVKCDIVSENTRITGLVGRRTKRVHFENNICESIPEFVTRFKTALNIQ